MCFRIEQGILNSSVSASLEEKSDFHMDGVNCAVRVFERYSYTGNNRLTLTVTIFGKDDGPVEISGITTGGSQAVLFKINTFGEDAFLDKLRKVLNDIRWFSIICGYFRM